MKITLDLNEALLAEATGLAAREGTTLIGLIEEGLRLRLLQQVEAIPVEIPIYRGKGGLAAGLDGLNNRALRDTMDG